MEAMDEKRSSLQIVLCVLLGFSALVFAENLTVTPAKCFLQRNLTVILNWRYHSEKLKEKHFDKDFVFFHDGRKLENEGGGATMVYPDKPYVNYELPVKKPGSYIGKVDSVNTTALVYNVKSEANLTSVARSGTDLNLTCVDEPEGTVILWEVNGVPVDQEKYRENDDGSLTVKKIDLPDVLRKISCRMFFTTDDREEYKTNKSNVPGYKTAVVNTPVLVYNTTRHSESESLCILQVASRKDGATVCGQKNLSDFCEKLGADISKVELDRDSNFTIFWNQKLLVMDHYKAPGEPVKSDEKEPTDDLTTIIVVVVVAVVLVVLLVAIWAKRTKHLCWKNTPQPNTSGTSNGRLYENHDTAARDPLCCPSCCFTVGANDKGAISEESLPMNPAVKKEDGEPGEEADIQFHKEDGEPGEEADIQFHSQPMNPAVKNSPCWSCSCFTNGAKDEGKNPNKEEDEREIQYPESV